MPYRTPGEISTPPLPKPGLVLTDTRRAEGCIELFRFNGQGFRKHSAECVGTRLQALLSVNIGPPYPALSNYLNFGVNNQLPPALAFHSK